MIRKFGVLAAICVFTMAPASYAIAGGYFGISAGSSEDDILNESSTGFKLAVGSLVDKTVGIEIAYVDLGTITINSFDFSKHGLTASVVPVLKINAQASAFAKIGLFDWTFAVDTGNNTIEETGRNRFLGLGIEYEFRNRVALVAEYENYQMADNDVSLLSAGVRIGY